MSEAWERYLTERETSDMTGISVNTLQNWRILNKGPRYVKPGGRSVRYPLSSLREFMEARSGGGES